jgi:multiple sugar transport system substrate-binding protein
MFDPQRHATSRVSRRAVLGLLAAGASGLLVACIGSTPAAPAKPAESKPAESKPAESKPAAPAAQPAATTAPAKPAEAAKPADAAKPAAAAPAASKKLSGEVRLHVRAGNEVDTLNEYLPKFTQDTGVKVNVEAIPSAEYFTKLQTLIGGGTAGDVWWGAYRDVPRQATSKVVMRLDDLVAADKFDLSQYYPAAIDASRYQGGLYALPFKLHPGAAALYYNANQLTEAGVTMPEKGFPTFDALIEAAKKLTKTNGARVERYGLVLPITSDSGTNTLQAFMAYARAWGGDVFSEDGKKALFTEPPARDAIRFMVDMVHKHKVAAPGQDFTQQFEDLMLAQRASMLQAASSTKSITTKTGGKFEVKNVVMPPGPTGKVGSVAITDNIFINAKSKNPDGAWELVKLLCGFDVGVRLAGGTGGNASGTSGGRKDVFVDPKLMAQPLHPIFVDLVQNAKAPIIPANLRLDEAATATLQTMAPVWLGERPADDAFFAELNAVVQSVMDRPMP